MKRNCSCNQCFALPTQKREKKLRVGSICKELERMVGSKKVCFPDKGCGLWQVTPIVAAISEHQNHVCSLASED